MRECAPPAPHGPQATGAPAPSTCTCPRPRVLGMWPWVGLGHSPHAHYTFTRVFPAAYSCLRSIDLRESGCESLSLKPEHRATLDAAFRGSYWHHRYSADCCCEKSLVLPFASLYLRQGGGAYIKRVLGTTLATLWRRSLSSSVS